MACRGVKDLTPRQLAVLEQARAQGNGKLPRSTTTVTANVLKGLGLIEPAKAGLVVTPDVDAVLRKAA